MSDDGAPPFDPNAPAMFFAAPEAENEFSKTPANVTNDFIKEAILNAAAATGTAPSEANSPPIRDAGAETPSSIPRRPAVTAISKRKRISKFPSSDDEEDTGVNGSPAAETPPAAKSSATPYSLPGLPPPKKRKRKPGKKQLNSRVIPRSLAECDDADKELITLREAGSEWKVIRARWEELTGEQTATSTLPNRYARLKSNFTVIKEEDNAYLIAAKREVEESFEGQKWDLISRVVKEKGGENYAGIVLKRQYKKLMVNNGAIPPPGVQDVDFEVELPDSDGE